MLWQNWIISCYEGLLDISPKLWLIFDDTLARHFNDDWVPCYCLKNLNRPLKDLISVMYALKG